MLLSFSGSLPAKCIFLNNQTCITRPTFIDLNPVEYNWGLHQYPFMVSLDRCNGGCNTPDDLSSRTFSLNKTWDINLNVINITGINEPTTLIKYISCNWKYTFDHKNVV